MLRPYNTGCFTRVFHFSYVSGVFPQVLDTNMLLSKTGVKKSEKREKSARKMKKKLSPRQKIFSILYYALGFNI